MYSTFEWAWPWAALALPLPLLVRWLLPAVQEHPAVLRVPFTADFMALEGASQAVRFRLELWLAVLAWIALVGAACRPQWLGEAVALPMAGRNLMLAVDISRSMQQRDMSLPGLRRANRLQAVQQVAGDFITRRDTDRIGLILFGDEPFLQSPLTRDRKSVRLLLNQAEIGFLGKRTALGDAIGLAIKRLRDYEGERILILLTDGRNTAGEADPVTAAGYAAAAGLRIYTIGVGGTGRRGLFGSRTQELDEDTLSKVAELTGGRYFRARDRHELEEIYEALDRFELSEEEEQGFRPRHEWFPWPLGAAVLLAVLALLKAQGWPGTREGVQDAG